MGLVFFLFKYRRHLTSSGVSNFDQDSSLPRCQIYLKVCHSRYFVNKKIYIQNKQRNISLFPDEYTKITTPRQDVLFKKGYLNKPKNYQTQTSTGTSTTSTGNGTPDHQSTGKTRIIIIHHPLPRPSLTTCTNRERSLWGEFPGWFCSKVLIVLNVGKPYDKC